MTLKEKENVFKQLTKGQQQEIRRVSRYFNACVWQNDPSQELYGVKWYQTDLIKIL